MPPRIRTFSSARQPAAPAGPAGGRTFTFPFKLDDVTFTCVLRDDADAALEWSEMAALAADGVDAESPEAAAAIGRVLRVAFEPAEYRRLRHHLRAHLTPIDTLMELLSAINEEMEKLVAKAAARPTAPPSPSSGGGAARAGRRSQLALLQAAGDVHIVQPGDQPARKPRTRRPPPRRTG